LNQNGNQINYVTLRASDDAWVVVYDNNKWKAHTDIPTELRNRLTLLSSQSFTITAVAMGPNNTWIVTYGTNGYYYSGVPSGLQSALIQAGSLARNITNVILGPDANSWALTYGQNGYQSQNIPSELFNAMRDVGTNGGTIRRLAIGAGNNWALVSNRNTYQTRNVPNNLFNALDDIADNNFQVSGIALGRSGSYAVTYDRNAWYANATKSRRP
jgi:surface antigen